MLFSKLQKIDGLSTDPKTVRVQIDGNNTPFKYVRIDTLEDTFDKKKYFISDYLIKIGTDNSRKYEYGLNYNIEIFSLIHNLGYVFSASLNTREEIGGCTELSFHCMLNTVECEDAASMSSTPHGPLHINDLNGKNGYDSYRPNMCIVLCTKGTL